MGKILAGVIGFIVLTAGVGFLFKAEVKSFVRENITRGMFVEADTDSFDPGLPVGASFPAIKAIHRGQQVTSIQQFMGDKGLAVYAIRSVDW